MPDHNTEVIEATAPGRRGAQLAFPAGEGAATPEAGSIGAVGEFESHRPISSGFPRGYTQ